MERLRRVYVGIDVHRLRHSAAVLPLEVLETAEPRWREIKCMSLENTLKDYEALDAEIKKCANSPTDVAIAVDQTGRYSEPLMNFLQQKGYPLYYVEAKGVKGVRRNLLDEENKDDPKDAAGFAYLLYLQDKHGTSFRVSEIKADLGSKATILRTLVLQRMQYSKLINQTVNRLRQLLYLVFPEGENRYAAPLIKMAAKYPTPQDLIAAAKSDDWRYVKSKRKNQILKLAENTIGVKNNEYRDLIKYLATLHDDACKKRQALDKTTEQEVLLHLYGPILLSFPTIAVGDAAVFISIIKHIENWNSDRKLRKAFGVYPITLRSGRRLDRRKQGSEGDRYAKGSLCRIVMTCLTPTAPPNDFRDYYVRRVAKGCPKRKALMITAGKLAETIYHCVKNGEPYCYQGCYRRRIPRFLMRKYYPEHESHEL